MREDALANHARDSRKQYSGRDEARASDRDRLGSSFGGALVGHDVVACGRDAGSIKRGFFLIVDGYGSAPKKFGLV
jgi:hypothetical protein